MGGSRGGGARGGGARGSGCGVGSSGRRSAVSDRVDVAKVGTIR